MFRDRGRCHQILSGSWMNSGPPRQLLLRHQLAGTGAGASWLPSSLLLRTCQKPSRGRGLPSSCPRHRPVTSLDPGGSASLWFCWPALGRKKMKRTTLVLLALAFASPAVSAHDSARGSYDGDYGHIATNTKFMPAYNDYRYPNHLITGSTQWDAGSSYVDSGDYYTGASRPN